MPTPYYALAISGAQATSQRVALESLDRCEGPGGRQFQIQAELDNEVGEVCLEKEHYDDVYSREKTLEVDLMRKTVMKGGEQGFGAFG